MTAETTAETTHLYKIARVAGQEFGPIGMDVANETIRAQVLSMGFADVGSAEIKEEARTVEGGTALVIEFVKRAGTKGLDSLELLALLRRLPPAQTPCRVADLSAREVCELRRLQAGEMTVQEFLDDTLAWSAMQKLNQQVATRHTTMGGTRLCMDLDRLTPAAIADGCAW